MSTPAEPLALFGELAAPATVDIHLDDLVLRRADGVEIARHTTEGWITAEGLPTRDRTRAARRARPDGRIDGRRRATGSDEPHREHAALTANPPPGARLAITDL
jgi:hypothetical protein